MGKKDIITKDYMSDSRIFANVFNNIMYKGEQIVDPEKLRPLDSTAIGVPYGAAGAEAPVQKFRDEWKYLTAMEDDSKIYLLLGIENQSEIHYAMPVKNMVYDSLGYAGQVERSARSYRRTKEKDGRRPTRGEYLTGFHQVDARSARVISEVTGAKIQFEESEGMVDMNNVWDEIREEGRNIGMKEGRNIGMKEGHNIGMKEGRNIGELEGRRKIAKKMLRDRRFSLEDVSKFSGLSVKELKSLGR